jgi:isoamylase
MQLQSGTPAPYGLSFHDGKVNFSLYAPHAKFLELHFYEHEKIKMTVIFDPEINKTGHIWHGMLEAHDIMNLDYLFFVDNKHYVFDPYAKFLNTSNIWGEGAKPIKTKAQIKQHDFFDWENVKAPKHKLNELIIYEMHTRSFTKKSSVKFPGTFLGIIEKIPHLKKLGINAVELMPIFEFNECEVPFEGLCNYWGYSPISYFALMGRYAANKGCVLEEFKTLVKQLHQNDISVIIDVVYNHTGEGSKTGPLYNLKALDPHYYIVDKHLNFIDYSGCGNTLDANRFPSLHLIMESLRFLAIDCHVDGFRFDLGSTFYRDAHGYLPHPRIIDAIKQDPVLSQKILISEAWDAAGLYQVGKFPKPFADWNGAYRDKVRSFLKGDQHSKGAFADALSGTCSLYFEKSPAYSINFITAHDGFTLHDLFSYNSKHNLANKEDNRDGANHNISYNFGCEGPSDDPNITKARYNLIKLSFAILFLSLGTPMMLMGDEYGHTRGGNNNAWCQDNDLNYFLWDQVSDEMLNYIQSLASLRKKIKRLSEDAFFSKKEISWHGQDYKHIAWDTHDGFLSYILNDEYLVMFNASSSNKMLSIPEGHWKCLLDSNFMLNHGENILDVTHFVIHPHSCIVLEKASVDKQHREKL